MMRRKKRETFLIVLLFVILRWTISPAVLCGQQQAKPDKGSSEVELGLAVKYTGDKGIEKDTAVLFTTGFEKEGLDGWWDIRNRDGIKFVDDISIVHSGSKCLQMTAVKGKDEGSDMKHTLTKGVDQLYMRFYCRFHKDTLGPHHFIIMGTHVKGWWANAGRRPPGDKGFWTNIEPPTDKRGWEFYTYWHKMRSWNNEDGTPNNPPEGNGRSFYGNTFVPDDQPTGLPRERWICVEIMMKTNTIGKSDGEQAFWIDGKKMGHWKPGEPIGSWFRATFHTSGPFNIDPKPFEGYDWRSDPELKLNHIILQWYISKEHGQKAKVDENIVYFDDIVLATEYIGPQVKNISKKP